MSKRRYYQCIYHPVLPTKDAHVTHIEYSKTPSSEADMLPAYVPLLLFEIERTDYLINKPGKETGVISPTGRNIKKIWVTGTLTSYEPGRHGDIIRVSDPTGAANFFLRPHAPEGYEKEDLAPPLFISITARPEKETGSSNTGIRWVVEALKITTKQDRDAWIVAAASSLIQNLWMMKSSLNSEEGDPQVREAQRHYRTRNEQLKFFAENAEKALRVIKEPGPPIDPAELILSIIKEQSGPRGVHLDDILKGTRREALADDIVRDIIRALVLEDEIYQPAPGYLKLL
ncbi:MAG TPA: hypothetical protein PKX11_06855 [Methanospirillum sp.]|nr:hypothetical protein [Methanospirillum sp.]